MGGDWSKPVEIELGQIGLYRVISDTQSAADTLLYRWPRDYGQALSEAKRMCIAVLAGEEEPQAARIAFIAAAEEADLGVRRAQRYLPEGKSAEQRWARKRLRA